ncbi:MAG: reverse gyrase [Desulfurococcales archaeon]|nr:reverse gyrase [Desulfurococcales archaeon]
MLINPGRGFYRHACPNCGGPISEYRLVNRLPCEKCIDPKFILENKFKLENITIYDIYNILNDVGTLKEYKRVYELEREASSLIEFFTDILESPPWGAQRTWIRRLVRKDSFSIIAPTGVGKTTFGIIASIYMACNKNLKSYIVLPTTTLVLQVYKRIEELIGKIKRCNIKTISIHSKLNRKTRLEALEALENGDFHILITTAAFARKNPELLSKWEYRFVFVDDVDAVLRSAKSVDAILRIVGFSDKDIENGLEMLKLQRELASLRNRYQTYLQAGKVQAAERVRESIARLELKIDELSKMLNEARRRVGSLVVSSATGRPRGSRVRLFRVLLNFEAGGRSDIGLRRVIDAYTLPVISLYDTVASLVRKIGGGGLIYVPVDMGIEEAEGLASFLKERGVKAEAYHAKKPASILEDFIEGKIDVLVGVANYYGVLVRGLDLPERVRYAIFAGVPRHKFPADIGEPHPLRLIRLLAILSEIPVEDIANESRRHLVNLRRLVRRMSPAAIQYIVERVIEGDVGKAGSPAWIIAEAYNFLRQALSDDDIWRHISMRNDVGVVVSDGRRYILIADPATYIQASGRTSRLYAGGITLGLSIVVVDDERVFRGLVKRTQWMVDASWKSLDELDLEKIVKDIDKDREMVRDILKRGKAKARDLVKTALLVVESPNKARTIASFFGQPSIRVLPSGMRAYEVATGNYILMITASGGHVYDLVQDSAVKGLPRDVMLNVREEIFGVIHFKPRDNIPEFIPVYTSIKRCLDCGYQFTSDRDRCPVCGSSRIRDTRFIIDDLRNLAWESDIVLIGTDPDTEGEKIGWDVSLLLKPYSRRVARLEFHEVTRPAIIRALENLRDFDQKLVDAQIVRRVEDRWIGFTLSPLLWCHFWPKVYCPYIGDKEGSHGQFITWEIDRCKRIKYYYNLSAGRVQTPTLGWVVERTRQAQEKINAYRINIDGYRIFIREDQLDPRAARELALIFKGKTRQILEVHVKTVESSEDKLNPPPPYTTDAMIADASRYLRLGAVETMRLAQDLFEWGLITYHRTDSTRISEKGMQIARQWLEEKYGDYASKLFKPRSWGAEGAHEAIRPVRPIDADTLRILVDEGAIELVGELSQRHLRLYDLIFRRFMASQMREALVRRAVYEITILAAQASVRHEAIIAIGKDDDVVSRGFTLVWPYIWKAPELREGYIDAEIDLIKISKVQLYTQGELIEDMKKKGIGRPSTYAKIVETLLKRRYITKPPKVKDDYIVSTIRGEKVYEYLTRTLLYIDPRDISDRIDAKSLKNIPSLVSEERTRTLEEAMDSIERGERDRDEVLKEIYEEIRGLAQPISRTITKIDRGGARDSLADCLSRAYVVVREE